MQNEFDFLKDNIERLSEQLKEQVNSSSFDQDEETVKQNLQQLEDLKVICMKKLKGETFEVKQPKKKKINYKEPIKVALTGGSGNIGYAITFRICSGAVFGEDQPIILSLIDIPSQHEKLMGISMEIEDCKFPLVQNIEFHTNQNQGFLNTDYIFLVGSIPMPRDCEKTSGASFRTKYLQDNSKIFRTQAIAINENAKPTCKILVVSNPCNTLAYLTAQWCTNIPAENITAMSRLDHQRAVTQISQKFKCSPADIENLAIWGNHSVTMYPDISNLKIKNSNINVQDAIDKDWVYNFISKVRNRGVEIIKWSKITSIASAANAAVCHMRDWAQGTNNQWVSMAVPSDGSYGIPKNIIYSYPVICENGSYKIVQGLKHSDYAQQQLNEATEELLSEINSIQQFLPEQLSSS